MADASGRKMNTHRRNLRILEEYKRLYDVERIRHDDCLKKLSEQFFLSETSISRILSKTI